MLTERVATLSSPIMVARYECGSGNVWREHSRGFIVPDDWPDHAAELANSNGRAAG